MTHCKVAMLAHWQSMQSSLTRSFIGSSCWIRLLVNNLGDSVPLLINFLHQFNYCACFQRGAGKSTPHACLEENTTWDLVADIERLWKHLQLALLCRLDDHSPMTVCPPQLYCLPTIDMFISALLSYLHY